MCGNIGPHILFFKNNFLLLKDIKGNKKNKEDCVYNLLYSQKLTPRQAFYIGKNIHKMQRGLKKYKQTIRPLKIEYQLYNNYLYWRYGIWKDKNIDLFVNKIKNNPNKQLIYGDFNPKNMVLNGNTLKLCDFETVHLGDPLLDIAFFIGHLIYSSFNKIEYSQKLVENFLRSFRLNKEEELIATNLSIATIYYRIKTQYKYNVAFNLDKKRFEKLIKKLMEIKPSTFKNLFLYLKNNSDSVF